MEYSSKIEIAKDLMLMLGLNETIGELAMENNVCWYGNMLWMDDVHVLRKVLRLEEEGQSKLEMPNGQGISRLMKKT